MTKKRKLVDSDVDALAREYFKASETRRKEIEEKVSSITELSEILRYLPIYSVMGDTLNNIILNKVKQFGDEAIIRLHKMGLTGTDKYNDDGRSSVAGDILVKIVEIRHLPLFLEMLHHEHYGVRVRSLQFVVYLMGNQSIEILYECLNDAHPLIRNHSALMLFRFAQDGVEDSQKVINALKYLLFKEVPSSHEELMLKGDVVHMLERLKMDEARQVIADAKEAGIEWHQIKW